MTFAVQFGKNDTILFLKASPDERARVRLAMLRLGFRGGTFSPKYSPMNAQYDWAMYLGTVGGGYATPENKDAIEEAARRAMGAQQPVQLPPTAASSGSIAPPVPAVPPGLTAWEQALTAALDQFPEQSAQEQVLILDPGQIAMAIRARKYRHADRLIELLRRQKVTESTLAPYVLHLYVEQQRWNEATEYYDANADALSDRLSCIRASTAFLLTDQYDRTRKILASDLPETLTVATDAQQVELYARAQWSLDAPLLALQHLQRLLDAPSLTHDGYNRTRWQQLRAHWIGACQTRLASMSAGEERRALIDALLPYATPNERAALLPLRGAERPSAVEATLDRARAALDAREPEQANAILIRMPEPDTPTDRTYRNLLRAEALFGLGRLDESVVLDARLVEDSAVGNLARRACFARLIKAALAQEDWDAVVHWAHVPVAAADASLLHDPEIERAVSLAHARRGDAVDVRQGLVAALRRNETDLEVATALYSMRNVLTTDEYEQALTCLVQESPQDAERALVLAEIREARGAYGDALHAVLPYLQAMRGYLPTEETVQVAEMALLYATLGEQHAQVTTEELVAVARRFVEVTVRAGHTDLLVNNYFEECLHLSPDSGDQLAVIEPVEVTTDMRLREMAIAACAEIFETQRRMQYPPHLHLVALLLDSLDSDRLRALVPNVAEREQYEAGGALDLSEQRLCIVGGTASARGHALDFLGRQYQLPRGGQREIEPFEEHFSEARMRNLLVHNGRPAIDLVIHVPECESHAVFYALRKVRESLRSRGLDLPMRAAEGSGQTSMIRAVEEYYLNRAAGVPPDVP